MLFLTVISLCLAAPGAVKKKDNGAEAKGEITRSELNLLWREPADIRSRNLFYGPGGKAHEPHGTTFTFVEEDLDGSNPKFVVKDKDGIKWKIKLGEEARPETAAARIVWGVGYFANEDYFLHEVRVKNMPAHLHRGEKLVTPDGVMYDVRLKRHESGEKKIGEWTWKNDPFAGTRELNGLRVLMAVINNWDLKDQNNAIYEVKHPQDHPEDDERVYMVSDLGASFGSAGLERTHEKSKGNLDSYMHSPFIRRMDANTVDFQIPHRPAVVVAVNPREFISRLKLRWIGRRVPREDAKWMGQMLGRLSHSQIRDAFRAAQYSPQEVEGFTAVMEQRIAELKKL